MNKNLDLSIIIVSYNAEKFLRDCLHSIKVHAGDITYEVIVVDNASSDDSVAMIKKEFSWVQLIENENEGFAKANNRGVKVAKGKYILFLNPDTVVYEKTLPGMLEFIETHPDAGAVTCKLEMPGGGIDYASHRGFPTPWNSFTYFSGLGKVFGKTEIFGGYTLGYKDFSKTHEIDALAGAFMLTRREAGDAVGWWPEDYFFNGEDIDFCYALKEKGWKIYYVPEFAILHYNGVSGGTKKASAGITTANLETKRRIQKYRFDAMRIFYKKYYAKKYPSLVSSLVMIGIAAKEWMVMRKLR